MRCLLANLVLVVAGMSSAQAAPKSLFVQASNILTVPGGETTVRMMFNAVCQHHRDGAPAEDQINNLVIQKVADENGNLYTNSLDVMKDYFPCFSAVFIGGSRTPWTGAAGTSPFVEGIMDPTYRSANIAYTKTVAGKVLDFLPPDKVVHWYLPYEANLNAFANDGVKAGYAQYLSGASQALTDLQNERGLGKRSILWSPTFWTPYATLSQTAKTDLTADLTDVFRASPLVNRLEFQDFIGQASTVTCMSSSTDCLPWQQVQYPIGCDNTKGYYDLLKVVQANANYSLVNVMVNMEMFLTARYTNAQGEPVISFVPGDPRELANREACYAQKQIPIGASWEIRYWFLTNYGTPVVKWEYPVIAP